MTELKTTIHCKWLENLKRKSNFKRKNERIAQHTFGTLPFSLTQTIASKRQTAKSSHPHLDS
jgi:hypothetical protein